MSDAQGAAALGVEAIFCLSGDHQSLGAFPQSAGVYDIDSIQLIQALKKMMREGSLPELPIGAAAHPYQQPLELGLLRLRKKIAAGADFVLTQAVFDLAGFARWMDAVRAAGLDAKVAILASVLPLASVEQARLWPAAHLWTGAGERHRPVDRRLRSRHGGNRHRGGNGASTQNRPRRPRHSRPQRRVRIVGRHGDRASRIGPVSEARYARSLPY